MASQMVINYKANNNQLSNWNDERPGTCFQWLLSNMIIQKSHKIKKLNNKQESFYFCYFIASLSILLIYYYRAPLSIPQIANDCVGIADCRKKSEMKIGLDVDLNYVNINFDLCFKDMGHYFRSILCHLPAMLE